MASTVQPDNVVLGFPLNHTHDQLRAKACSSPIVNPKQFTKKSFWSPLGIGNVKMKELEVSSKDLGKWIRGDLWWLDLLLATKTKEGRSSFDLIDQAGVVARLMT